MLPVFQLFRSTLRSLRAQVSYAIISILVIAISVGALLAATALLDGLLLRTPSGRHPEQLVYINSTLPGGPLSRPDIIDLQAQFASASDVVAFDDTANVALEIAGRTFNGDCAAVTGNYFTALGLAPQRGRVFSATDDRIGAEPVVILATSLALKLNASLDALIKINARPFRVIGILSPDFEAIERNSRAELWIPLEAATAYRAPWVLTSRDTQWLQGVARLKADQTAATANAELTVLAKRIQHEHPDVNHGMGLSVLSLREARLQGQQAVRIMLVVGATVVAFFALGFLNFFSLTLIRLISRRRQIAIRLALGSTRRQLAGWLLTELLAILGGGCLAGLAVSWALFRIIAQDPRLGNICASAGVQRNARSVVPTFSAAAVACIVIWILAVHAASTVELNTVLKESVSAPRSQRTFTAVFAAQFAVTLCLVALSLSFVKTLESAASQKFPFRETNVLLAPADVRRLGWGADQARINRFHESVLNRLRTLPGVISVAASNRPPLVGTGWTNVFADGKDPALSADQCIADWTFVSADYFKTMGILLRVGREFTQAEETQNAHVAVVNRAMAQRYWPGEDPLGKTFRAWPTDDLHQVIGVAENVPSKRDQAVRPAFYYLYTASLNSRMTYLVQVQTESAAATRLVREMLASLWPSADSPEVNSIEKQISGSWGELAAAVTVVLWVSGLGTAITAVGLYVFSHYTAAQGVRDAAIRCALGATSVDLAKQHLRRFQGALLVGGALGVLLTILAVILLSKFQISLMPTSPLELIGAALIIGTITAIGLFTPLVRLVSSDLKRLLGTAN